MKKLILLSLCLLASGVTMAGNLNNVKSPYVLKKTYAINDGYVGYAYVEGIGILSFYGSPSSITSAENYSTSEWYGVDGSVVGSNGSGPLVSLDIYTDFGTFHYSGNIYF